ncbi:YdhR family protein [Parafrankia elaeagni]|uniref:YdhR family protein n=1 Tax=Parafrankia elaeagni TaxID=222534 RepID=UPI000361A7A1|nr:YdhR family protein [Parafrankia elaeagni]
MHVQIVTFHLDGLDEASYRNHVDTIAPTFAGLRGLRSKVWLGDTGTNTYGGVYLWDDEASMRAYQNGEIFAGLRANPAMADVVSRDFAVLRAPTEITRGC